MKVYDQQQIMRALDLGRAAERIAQGFIAFSQGKVTVPPVQSFVFPGANGDCCVKSAWVESEDTFTIKVSTGFYDNLAQGLESNNGLMLVFCALTGQPRALLQDGGWLTCLRTALAGQLAARALAPSTVEAIGIVGTGVQARMQLKHLMPATDCRKVIVWGRGPAQLGAYRAFAQGLGFTVQTTLDAEQVALKANLIVTTTPSRVALIKRAWIRPGTHITAVGADTPGKQELDPAIVGQADVIVVDSVAQCSQYGEVSHALKAGLISQGQLRELGRVLCNDAPARTNDQQVTLMDLTGVAVQDAQISRCALEACAAAGS